MWYGVFSFFFNKNQVSLVSILPYPSLYIACCQFWCQDQAQYMRNHSSSWEVPKRVWGWDYSQWSLQHVCVQLSAGLSGSQHCPCSNWGWLQYSYVYKFLPSFLIISPSMHPSSIYFLHFSLPPSSSLAPSPSLQRLSGWVQSSRRWVPPTGPQLPGARGTV